MTHRLAGFIVWTAMLVKICGITNLEDARTAEQAGADFIGLNFVEKSKRAVKPDQVRLILTGMQGKARAVGLFQNHPLDHVVAIVSTLGLSIVQLHGEEPSDYINDLLARLPECRVLKAVMVETAQTILGLDRYFQSIQKPQGILGFLLDAPGGGGTGKSFDWARTAEVLNAVRKKFPPIFLAGGLTIDNISDAIRTLKPDGVDVSSGVEAAPGKKDAEKVRTFIRLARESR